MPRHVQRREISVANQLECDVRHRVNSRELFNNPNQICRRRLPALEFLGVHDNILIIVCSAVVWHEARAPILAALRGPAAMNRGMRWPEPASLAAAALRHANLIQFRRLRRQAGARSGSGSKIYCSD
jgi:hypothetical protein